MFSSKIGWIWTEGIPAKTKLAINPPVEARFLGTRWIVSDPYTGVALAFERQDLTDIMLDVSRSLSLQWDRLTKKKAGGGELNGWEAEFMARVQEVTA